MRNRRKIFNNKRFGWAILLTLIVCFSAIIFSVCTGNSAFATTSDEVVETNFFGNYTDDGEGCGVYMILNMIIDILSIGIAITGVIGVTLVGIQYMTAKDSEEKTRKAKNRMLEIVIGLVAYAALFAGVQWLLPGGLMNNSCKSISDEKLAQMKENEKKKEEEEKKKQQAEQQNKKNEKTAKKQKQEQQQKNKAYKKCMERAAKVVRDKVCKVEDPVERIVKTAKLLAGSRDYASYVYKQAMKQTDSNNRNDSCQKSGESCNTYVATVLRASGVDLGIPTGNKGEGNWTGALSTYFKNHKNKWKFISHNPYSSRNGDVVIVGGEHVTITVKNSQGKLVTAHASHCTDFPFISGGIYNGYSGTPSVYRYIGK